MEIPEDGVHHIAMFDVVRSEWEDTMQEAESSEFPMGKTPGWLEGVSKEVRSILAASSHQVVYEAVKPFESGKIHRFFHGHLVT